MKDQRQIPRRNPTPAFWFVPMKTVQQPGQVFILADVNSGIPHFVGYGSPIAFYGTRLILFIWGFYVAFNTVQVISRRVVGRAEETST